MAKYKKSIHFEGKPPDKLEAFPFYGVTLNDEQLIFANAIWNPDIDIVFVDAKAGTGKTFVSLGVSNMLVKYGLYDDIIYLVNATQEQKIGYRPGTTEMKLAPYFMPLYDAAINLGINPSLDVVMCTDTWEDKGDAFVKCTSPIFMRGRNIPASKDMRTILICDEAQNMYVEELQTVLTRVNDGTKVIVIGHTGQCDLPSSPERSGFAPYIELFRDMPRSAVCTLTQNHRSWISRHADTIQSFLTEREGERDR